MKLVHEVWYEKDEGGESHMCCLAGPHGDGARAMLAAGARLLTTFEAESHFEAMTMYYAYLDRGPYTTDQSCDREPYPEEWLPHPWPLG